MVIKVVLSVSRMKYSQRLEHPVVLPDSDPEVISTNSSLTACLLYIINVNVNLSVTFYKLRLDGTSEKDIGYFIS